MNDKALSMPKVILVNPSGSYNDKKSDQVVYPCTVVIVLGTMLDKAGYWVKIIDGNLYDTSDCIRQISGSIDEYTIFR